MGDRVAERFQLVHRRLQLSRAQPHALLQFGVQPVQVLLGLFAIADVADEADVQLLAAGPLNLRDRQLHGKLRAVGAHRPHLEPPAQDGVVTGLAMPGETGAMPFPEIGRDDQVRERPADRVVSAIAERALGSRVELDDAALHIHRDDAVERRFEDESEAVGARERVRRHSRPVASCRSIQPRMSAAGPGFRDEVALCGVASELPQAVPRLGGLDAFGHHGQTEVMGKIDRRPDDGVIAGHEAAHERPVDLQAVDRQAAQVAEGGIADPVVVYRELHTHLVQPGETGHRTGRVREHEVLGNLEHERRRGRLAAPKHVGDLIGEPRIAQAPRRQVHGNRDRRYAVHTGPLGQRLVEQDQRQRFYQTGLLGELDELPRLQAPLARMIPSRERLDRPDRAGLEADDRLIVERELAVRDAVSQLGHQRQPPVRVAIAIGRIPGMAQAAALGDIHRDVGLL